MVVFEVASPLCNIFFSGMAFDFSQVLIARGFDGEGVPGKLPDVFVSLQSPSSSERIAPWDAFPVGLEFFAVFDGIEQFLCLGEHAGTVGGVKATYVQRERGDRRSKFLPSGAPGLPDGTPVHAFIATIAFRQFWDPYPIAS